MALYDLGQGTLALKRIAAAEDDSQSDPATNFEVTFALFLRLSDVSEPKVLLEKLGHLRQLASRVADARSLGALHLAVARLEGIRGGCHDAHRHLEISRRLIERQPLDGLLYALDLVEGSLESVAGNLARARRLADGCLNRARASGFAKHILGSATNLAAVALYQGHAARAQSYLNEVLPFSDSVTYVKLGALDTLTQVHLDREDYDECQRVLKKCEEAIAADSLPARSWYDLAHQVTRCGYFERIEQWKVILEICDEVDPELARRQYRAVRTTLLCAKARALARLGRDGHAQAALALAGRVCPRGAVDPLIVLEASHGVCLSMRGDAAAGSLHFERALSACRAIGHRYHERWIDRDRTTIAQTLRSTVAVAPPAIDPTNAALLFTDVGTILGAGHSIDLLAHRTRSLLQCTGLGSRLDVEDESGCEFQPDPSVTCETSPDGRFEMRLRGSDRRVTIRVRDVESLAEITLLRGIADVVQAAVHRTAGTEHEDDEDTLWPRTVFSADDNTVFRSPRMLELVRVAIRLASTNFPLLLTGETGTGKEIFARLVHDHSKVKRGPFVPFNCSAIPKDLVESQLFGHRRGAFTGAADTFPGVIRAAERGTLFLDEIADLDIAAQPKLLRWLEQGEVHPVGEVRPIPVSVRLVAATNADLEAMVKEGRFRSDLFYRLGGTRIALPPLRERKDEIPALADLFVSRYARECDRKGLRLGDDFVAALLLHDWPGNLRELANEIRRVVAMSADGDTLTSSALSPHIAARWNSRPVTVTAAPAAAVQIPLGQTLAAAIDELEQRFIDHALATTQGRVTEAADLLGLSRKGLFLKRRRRGLVPKVLGDAPTVTRAREA
jgi:DNA-binding NtrC family response regulator